MMKVLQFGSHTLTSLRDWGKAFLMGAGLVAGAVALLASCASADVVEPVTTATPAALPDADDTGPGGLEPATGTVGPVDTAEPGGTGPNANEPALIATAKLVDGAVQTSDVFGNLLAVHSMRAWPDSYAALRPFDRDDLGLAGPLDDLYPAASSIVALDVSVCAHTLGDRDAVDAFGTFTVGNSLDVPSPVQGNGALASSDSSLAPGFLWPAIGTCERGWVAVATTASLDDELYAQYWPVGDDPDHVLGWRVAATDAAPETVDDSFGAGQTISFTSGDLTGSSVEITGWAELVGTPASIEGTRPVGLLLQVCPATDGTWPMVGLAVDGWNLAEATVNSIDGLESLTSSADGCDSGWLVFDVPNGGQVTGAFVAEEPATPGARWTLANAALPDPS